MASLSDSILHLPGYRVTDATQTDDDFHFQVEAPEPVVYKACGTKTNLVKFGKRDVAYCDLPIHGKWVTLWVTRRRYCCRACKATFRPEPPERVEGFR